MGEPVAGRQIFSARRMVDNANKAGGPDDGDKRGTQAEPGGAGGAGLSPPKQVAIPVSTIVVRPRRRSCGSGPIATGAVRAGVNAVFPWQVPPCG